MKHAEVYGMAATQWDEGRIALLCSVFLGSHILYSLTASLLSNFRIYTCYYIAFDGSYPEAPYFLTVVCNRGSKFAADVILQPVAVVSICNDWLIDEKR